MFDFLLNNAEKALWEEVREFVKDDVPSQVILDMDAGKIETARPYLESAGGKNLL